MKNIILTAVISLLSASFIHASGGLAGSFLYSGGSGARSNAMANSNSADCAESSGAYLNPASVTGIKFREASFFYTAPFEDVNYSVVSLAVPMGDYGILSFFRAALFNGGIERISAEGISDGEFKDTQESYTLSYAYKFSRFISAGFSGKLITRSLDRYATSAFGLDAGIAADLGESFSVAAAVYNALPPSVKLNSKAETYPLNARFGLAARFFDNSLTACADFLFLNLLMDSSGYDEGKKANIETRPSAGLEYTILQTAAVRAGINGSFFTAGAGITSENFTIDYAAIFGTAGITHQFGITARFGMLASEREKRIEKEKLLVSEREKKLAEGMQGLSAGQILQSAQKDADDGRLESARDKIKLALKQKPSDEAALAMLNKTESLIKRRDAGLKYDEAAQLYMKGSRDKAAAIVAEAEKIWPGISEAKNKEYMETCDQKIDDRDYEAAGECYKMILGIDRDNEKAAERLDKVQELIKMMKK